MNPHSSASHTLAAQLAHIAAGLEPQPCFGSIVHIGAGAGLGLADYYCSPNAATPAAAPQPLFQRLLLVEGDADTAESLRSTVQGQSTVQVIEQAIAAQAHSASWYRYNLPSLNGLLPPEAWRTQYPRLQLSGQHAVHTQTLPTLLAGLELNPQQNHLLVLDIPGQPELLQPLPAELLQSFAWVVLCGDLANPLDAALPAALAAACYQPHGQFACGMAGTAWLFQRDDAELARAQMQQQLAGVKQRLQEREAALLGENETQAFRITELQQQLATLQQARGEADQQLQQLTEQLTGTNTQLEQAKAQASQQHSRADTLAEQLQTQQQDAQAKLTALQAELADARSTTSLAVKLQTLREQDLTDLQQRYQSALQVQSSQHELLQKLGERLNLAASYFHALEAPRTAPAQDEFPPYIPEIRQSKSQKKRKGQSTKARKKD